MLDASKLTLLCVVLCIAADANTAEYDDSWIVPTIESIVFTPSQIGVELRPTEHEGMLPRAEDHQRFYLADRIDSVFQQVDEAAFRALFELDHFYRRIYDYDERSPHFSLTEASGASVQRSCSSGSVLKINVVTSSLEVPISLPCKSRIADAAIINETMWTAPYTWATHGALGANGNVDIYSLGGQLEKSIRIGNIIIRAIAYDPWSADKWIISYEGIAVVSQDNHVARQYWPMHRFGEKGPDVFIDADDQRTLSDPLAVLAYSVGERNYSKFLSLVGSAPGAMDDFDLYLFYMYGNGVPLSEKASVLLEHVQPNDLWQEFACLLPYDDANALCELAPEQWPR